VVPAGEGYQPLALLGVGAELEHRVAVEGVVDRGDDAHRGVAPAQLLDGQRIGHVVQPGPTPLLRHRHAEQRQLGELLHHRVRKAVLLVQLPGVGDELAGGELAGQSLRLSLQIGQFEVHRIPSGR